MRTQARRARSGWTWPRRHSANARDRDPQCGRASPREGEAWPYGHPARGVGRRCRRQLKADKHVAKELNASAKDVDKAVQDAAKGLS